MHTPDIESRIRSYTEHMPAEDLVNLSALSLSVLRIITDLQDKHVPDTLETKKEDGTPATVTFCVECSAIEHSIIEYPCPTIIGIEEGLKYV